MFFRRAALGNLLSAFGFLWPKSMCLSSALVDCVRLSASPRCPTWGLHKSSLACGLFWLNLSSCDCVANVVFRRLVACMQLFWGLINYSSGPGFLKNAKTETNEGLPESSLMISKNE